MRNVIVNRLRRKAISDQLVVVAGDSLSNRQVSLSHVAKKIIDEHELPITPGSEFGVFKTWNRIIDTAEKRVNKEEIIQFVRNLVELIEVTDQMRKVARLPVADFIDLTISRSLQKALCELGKTPATYAFWPQNMGIWRQRDSKSPSVFSCFDFASPGGVREHALLNPQNRIYIENLMEMVTDKDLLLLNISASEAEHMLHLSYLVHSASKIVNTRDPQLNHQYWLQVGSSILNVAPEALLGHLMPAVGEDYSELDMAFPRQKLVEITRRKQYDCFISYTHKDAEFAARLERDLKIRGLHVWRDQNEIAIGDSFSKGIQEGLKDSYTFALILSQEALSRPWVREELNAAYNLRLAEELKILPVLYKDCEIPPFLIDYKYADFREEKRYTEQLGLLERAIRNAVKRIRRKK